MKMVTGMNTMAWMLAAALSCIGVSASAQTSCPIGFNDRPSIVGTWRSIGEWDGQSVEEINLKYVPGKTLSYTKCEMVTERQGFPFFGIVKYEVCTPVVECVSPHFLATITHITRSTNEIVKRTAKSKSSGSWLYFDIQSDDLLRFWVRPKNNDRTIKGIDYVMYEINKNGGYSEEWLKVQ
jgi:hypothetical protein